MKKVLVLMLAVFAFAGFGYADQIVIGPGSPCGIAGNNCGPFTFTVNATTSTASLTIFNGGTGTWQAQYFSLNLYSPNEVPTGYTASDSGTLDIFAGQGNNGNMVCNENGASGFCVNILSGGEIGSGETLTYTFSIDNGTLRPKSDWHLQAALTNDAGDKIALSTGPGATTVPEPASLALLGSGLAGVGGFFRRKLIR
jgi:hypothetical protein